MLRITNSLRNTSTNAFKSLITPLTLHQPIQRTFASKNNPDSWDYIPPNVGSHRKMWERDHVKKIKIRPKSRLVLRGRSNEPNIGFPPGDEPILDPIVTKGESRRLKRFRRVKDEVFRAEDQHGEEHHHGGNRHPKAGIPAPDAKYILRAITKKVNNRDEEITKRELRTEDKYSRFETERHAIDTLISRGFTEKFTLDSSGHYLVTPSGHKFSIEHAKLSEIHLIQGEHKSDEFTTPENLSSILLLGVQVFEEDMHLLMGGVMEITYDMLRSKEMVGFVNHITRLDATFFL